MKLLKKTKRNDQNIKIMGEAAWMYSCPNTNTIRSSDLNVANNPKKKENANKILKTSLVIIFTFSAFVSLFFVISGNAVVIKAKGIIRERVPDLLVEGGMHADVAVSTEMLQNRYPFSALQSEANVLIFPDLMSANTAYKLLEQLGGATSIGPVLLGMSKPVHVLQAFASTVQDIVNITAIAVLDAQHGKIC